MPTTRRRRSRGRAVLRLDALDISDLLDMLVFWSPPVREFDVKRARWLTWGEFFADYEAVRDEFLQDDCVLEAISRGEVIFAEAEYQRWAASGRPSEWKEGEGER